MEFRYREADFSSYPKGLMYSLDILGDWLYDDEKPFAQVQQLSVFETLKKAVYEGYFEELIQKYLLDNPHALFLLLCRKKGFRQKEKKLWKKSWKHIERVFPLKNCRTWCRKQKLWKRTRKRRKSRRRFPVFLC